MIDRQSQRTIYLTYFVPNHCKNYREGFVRYPPYEIIFYSAELVGARRSLAPQKGYEEISNLSPKATFELQKG